MKPVHPRPWDHADGAGVAELADAGDLKSRSASQHSLDSKRVIVAPLDRGDGLGTSTCAIRSNEEQTG